MIKTERLSASIGGSVILREVTVEAPPAVATALVGPNGAGKTTTLKAIMGLIRHGGRVYLAGRDVSSLPAHARAALGLGYSPEDRRLFPSLTVEENLKVAASALGLPQERLEIVYSLLPQIKPLLNRKAAALSGGQQKLVALARALLVGIKAVLLDEVFEGMSPKMRDDMAIVIREYVKTTGAAVLVAESNPDYVKFATYIYEIHRGVATPLEKT
jgi:ABC-type branched-chain amino acid transport systems, ATPase component